MRRNHTVGAMLLAGACLGAAACGGSGGGDGAAVPPTTPIKGSVTFELDAQDDASAGGQARLEPLGTSRTRVVVDGIDESEPGGGGANPVRLVPGTCDTPTEGSGYQLAAVKGSTSTTTLDVPLAKLLGRPYHIEVLLPPRAGQKSQGQSQGALIACGDVPSG